jgi:hypothetical protein
MNSVVLCLPRYMSKYINLLIPRPEQTTSSATVFSETWAVDYRDGASFGVVLAKIVTKPYGAIHLVRMHNFPIIGTPSVRMRTLATIPPLRTYAKIVSQYNTFSCINYRLPCELDGAATLRQIPPLI